MPGMQQARKVETRARAFDAGDSVHFRCRVADHGRADTLRELLQTQWHLRRKTYHRDPAAQEFN